MITKNDFLHVIDYREKQQEIPNLTQQQKDNAWDEFVKRRETDDIIADSYSEDAIYDREMDIADEVVDSMFTAE